MGEAAAAAAASGIKSAWTGRVEPTDDQWGPGLGETAAGFAEGSHGWRSGAVQVAVIGGGFHDLDDRHERLDRYADADLGYSEWIDQVRSGERVRPARQQINPNRASGQAPTIAHNLRIASSSQHPSETTGYCTFLVDKSSRHEI
ncbi:uncharacterized protein BO96DRAFT_487499 [Aspergillus niger CBS 101883]|uniref:Uncharacterized protein n=2 Tax=Aspergillus niger TaxID=5061 RepID=A2R6E0_ASPNC|nr:uncharacterized protein BO96DRAFT_487499 [Aspergillus niger CBS 101883]XP_059602635.1 hypothetical protein An15g07610 [Aspergillus niger]PYH51695.1 hypothetical protein BO96DRAFT_487499 [Aspergillus niger CBS 101883]CAK42648.1 hypothetical protein An15g07610 [Aspergillus niger]